MAEYESEHEESGVYCITVADNHTIVAGRNGNFSTIQQCWGVYGDSDSYNKGYRLFDWRVAESITLYGRKVIQYSAEQFVNEVNNIKDERGYDGQRAYQVGGDTDSVMTSVPFIDNSEKEGQQTVIDIATEACERVNDSYDEFAAETFNADGTYIELEIESYATRLFVPASKSGDGKKRYAQLTRWEEGTWYDPPQLEITGIDPVRSDRAPVTRDVVTDVLEIILRTDDQDTARERVYNYVSGVIDDINDGALDNDYIARPKGMGQPPEEYGSANRSAPPTYRGVKYANKHFDWEQMGSGANPRLLYIERVGGEWPQTYDTETAEDGTVVDAIAVEQPQKVPAAFEVDTSVMVEKTLESPLTTIFEPLHWSFSDCKLEGKQGRLSEYF
jgi:DNA polymerase I